ncbi:hypothetical protein BGZ74_004733, partial [Mortierella antarctica]
MSASTDFNKAADEGSIDQTPKVALAALEEEQSWNWFTIRTLITSGTGFFTDAYDVFIINLI